MENKKKRIAFVFGRPNLNEAKLQFMPFAFGPLRKLALNTNNEIDVYLTQNYTSFYKDYFPENVNFIFLDNSLIWRNGSGKKLYYLLNPFFYLITFWKKYDEVWGCGQAGIILGGKLSQKLGVKFICLNDEFPSISVSPIWKQNDIKYTGLADELIIPDEVRIPVLKEQVQFSAKTRFWVLPNIPLEKDVEHIPNISWQERLNITNKYMVYAGGISEENNIELMLAAFHYAKTNIYLIVIGKAGKYKNRYLNHHRIIWIEERLNDDELHSLIQQAVCSICYYNDFSDLEYVGKSSGKIMRSLLVGTPVITTNFNSLKFIEDEGMGLLVTTPVELTSAIENIEAKLTIFKDNIQKVIHQYTFEQYWNKIISSL
jgi:glycosyltransferase involved in cell wall biosynthesis